MVQGDDLPVVEVRGEDKIEYQRQRSHDANRPCKPQSACPQIMPYEEDERDNDYPKREMDPSHSTAVRLRRFGEHHGQLEEPHACCSRRHQGNEQIDSGRTLVEPGQKIHRRKRKADGRDVGPDDSDQIHISIACFCADMACTVSAVTIFSLLCRNAETTSFDNGPNKGLASM